MKVEASAGIESTSCRTGKEPLGAAASGTVVPPAATPPLLNARNVAEEAAPPSRQLTITFVESDRPTVGSWRDRSPSKALTAAAR